MSATIQISLTPQAQKIIADLKSFPADMAAAVARAMDQQNLLTVSHIQSTYLSFPKDGPTTFSGLRAVSTPGYRGTLRASNAVINGAEISSAIGTNITNKGFSYPALHEFGGSWTRTTKPGKVRLRTNAAGELLRQPGRMGAVFAASHHKRTREVAFPGGKTYTVTMPARAPITRGIEDRKDFYTAAISAAIVAAWGGGA